MNQIFRITIGQETVAGKLPSLRVGQGYNSLFHISGVGSDSVSPKVWVSIADNTYFWEGEWDNTLGLWVICVGSGATQIKGIYSYAITMGGETSESPTYIAGQGAFVVYANITTSTGEHGCDGISFIDLITALSERIAFLEDKLDVGLPMFDPENAYDIDMRNQVQAITTILRSLKQPTPPPTPPTP